MLRSNPSFNFITEVKERREDGLAAKLTKIRKKRGKF